MALLVAIVSDASKKGNDPVKTSELWCKGRCFETELRAFSLCDFDVLCVYWLKQHSAAIYDFQEIKIDIIKIVKKVVLLGRTEGCIQVINCKALNKMSIAAEGNLQGCIFLTSAPFGLTGQATSVQAFMNNV